MQFARFTNDDYYLIWDSDTIPLKPVKLFDDNNRPFFDMKTEYHVPYFETINRIFPDIRKTAKGSFISEHMIIKAEYMRELIDETASSSDLEGANFQEKIINAIDAKDLAGSGFSEFETYGSYVMVRHPKAYSLREWHSLRSGRRFYSDLSAIDEENRRWLSQKYDALSLEKWHKYVCFSRLIRLRVFHKLFSPEVLEKIPSPFASARRKLRMLIPDKYVPVIKRLLGMKKGA